MEKYMDELYITNIYNEYFTFMGIEKTTNLSSIFFDIEVASGTTAKFNINELLNDNYILHINPSIRNYNETHIKAILFHEFTHLYDFFVINNKLSDVNEIKTYLNSYSESNASNVELEILLKLPHKSQLYYNDLNISIPYLKDEITLANFLSEKFTGAICALLSFEPNPIIHPVTQLCYYFGYLKTLSNGKALFNNEIHEIKTPLKNDIIKLANAYWNNKPQLMSNYFLKLELDYATLFLEQQTV